MQSTKEKLVNELTRLDVVFWRKSGMADEGKYKHEPPMFRGRLAKIYESLSIKEIQELINIKEGKPSGYVNNNRTNIADWINYWNNFNLGLYLEILKAKNK
jgi:hypothetical protein